MSEIATQRIASFDGVGLAVHRIDPESGAGRPVLLLHGLFSDHAMNWVKFGHAARLAEAGFSAIMPDLRAHGDSEAPHSADAYPDNVLVRDALALAEALELEAGGFDLVGFSLGARTAVGAMLAGLEPRRAVIAGMGLSGLAGWDARAAFFTDAIDRFDTMDRTDPAYFARSFMKSQGTDRVAARLLLGAVADTAPEDLRRIDTRTLVLCGSEDRDNGSPEELAAALPNATHREVPGTHMGSVARPELGEAIAHFLSA